MKCDMVLTAKTRITTHIIMVRSLVFLPPPHALHLTFTSSTLFYIIITQPLTTLKICNDLQRRSLVLIAIKSNNKNNSNNHDERILMKSHWVSYVYTIRCRMINISIIILHTHSSLHPPCYLSLWYSSGLVEGSDDDCMWLYIKS